MLPLVVLVLCGFASVHGQASCTLCEILSAVKDLQQQAKATQSEIASLKETIKNIESTQSVLIERYGIKDGAKDCADLYTSGVRVSGVYSISPRDGRGPIAVYCDMVTDGGGWTVFQKRQDGSVDFFRGWTDYKLGFGNLNGEFWLGNDYISRLSNQDKYQLRVDLEDTSGTNVYAAYDMFSIASEKTNYQLALGKYSGTAGDSLGYHRGFPFSTKDRDNDSHSIHSLNCAALFKGAWWYGACHDSNLNGLYHHGKYASYADGVVWEHFKGNSYSLKRTSMKIRPAGFKSQK